jgi:hypothetical protein
VNTVIALALRPQVLAFAVAMEERLRANDRKGGWSSCTDTYLKNRTYEELREWYAAWKTGQPTLHEAADVANFLMMMADSHGELEARS